jgi:hypothetical protein
LLTHAIVLPFIAPIAIPAAVAVGVVMLLRGNEQSTTMMRDRFLRDIAPTISVACREALLSARKHLQITLDLVKDAIRRDTASRLAPLLQSNRAMSDDEAARRGLELKELMSYRPVVSEPR